MSLSDQEKLVHKTSLPAFVELFDVDLSAAGFPTPYYFTPMTDASGTEPLAWGGNLYYPYPIQITGIEQTSSGAPTRPQLALANVTDQKFFGTLAFLYGDLIGCAVTYRRTFSNYLGLGSFLAYNPLRFKIRQKLNQNNKVILFELRSPADNDRAYLPGRQMLRKDFPGLGTNKKI